MGYATWYVGDALDVLRTLPDASVDLVMTSPPFLALRSYLPADHPDKTKEIGSETTPGAFLDVLLDVVVELRRVLAPHGSLVVELGDTYASSGGPTGDEMGNERYPDGKSGGQVARRSRVNRRCHLCNGSGRVHNPMKQRVTVCPECNNDLGWPLAKSLCMIPSTFAWALAYGRNPWTGRELEPWRVRNLIAWCRPNPPVGALGDKMRPATSYLTVACTGGSRYFDLDAVRDGPVPENERGTLASNGKSERETIRTATGRPPYDWWEIPTHPYPGAHYATFPPDLCVRPIKAMCPSFVCLSCGLPMRYNQSDDSQELRRMRPVNHQPASNEVLHEKLRFGFDSPGALGTDTGTGLSATEPSVRVRGAAVAGASDGKQVRSNFRAPGGNGGALGADAPADRSRASQEWDQGRQPAGKSRGAGPRSASEDSSAAQESSAMPTLRRTPRDGGTCPRCGSGEFRVGLVLDPFAGSGTTLAVATGHGRDAIGIDIDPRNLELARQRVGLFLIEAAA